MKNAKEICEMAIKRKRYLLHNMPNGLDEKWSMSDLEPENWERINEEYRNEIFALVEVLKVFDRLGYRD